MTMTRQTKTKTETKTKTKTKTTQNPEAVGQSYEALSPIARTVYGIIDRAGVKGCTVDEIIAAKFGPFPGSLAQRCTRRKLITDALFELRWLVGPVELVRVYVTARHQSAAEAVADEAYLAARDPLYYK